MNANHRKIRSQSLPNWNGDQDDKLHYRLTIMGSAGVGKSCIISQFLYDRFISEYKETVEEFHRGEYTVDGRELILDILDTAGAHSFPAMRRLAISTSDAFVLVYSIDDESSFQGVKYLRDIILSERKGEHVPIVVVGNKADISDDKRAIMKETAESIVCFDWGNGYVEASAKDSVNVVGIFKEILRQANIEISKTPLPKRKRFASTSSDGSDISNSPTRERNKSCVIS
ncbi:ras-related protein Rap-1b-like [Saccostrea echinata]|uniref:ras-related protein Rap-1b-like n=1 Tax=Saccostrea echinata TaxID=191078 RepID=UPI002A803E3D|nr:ras-related protein Rap-1b-like [Saccostrea echinata]